MTRTNFKNIFLMFTVALCLSALAPTASAQIMTDRLFPSTTKGFFAISDVNHLCQQWRSTDFGSTIRTEPFDPFRQSFSEQLEQSWIRRFGMTFNDVISIASGEIGGGLVAAPGKTPGLALIISVKGREKELNTFLTKLIKKVTSDPNGASRREAITTKRGSAEVTVLTFPDEKNPVVLRTVYFALVGGYFFAADQKYLLEQIFGDRSSPLAGNVVYQTIMRRCTADYPEQKEPQVRFFVVPLEFGEALYSLQNSASKEGTRPMSPWPILANQGFSGIQGVGGIFDFGTEQYEGIFRMKVYIPEQPTLALKMLRFLDSKEIPVPDWVGQESSRCSFLNMDILSLFNNMGPLFDDFVGTAGVWEDTLQSLEKDEKGPKVNLKTELIAHLGPQISVMRTFQDFNEKVFIGVQIRDGQSKEVSSALHRMFDNDPDFTSVPYGGDVIWSHTPKVQQSEPTRVSGRHGARAQGRAQQTQETQQQSKFRYAFYVADDTLFASNDAEALRQHLDRRAAGDIVSVEKTLNYQTISAILSNAAGPNGYSFKIFANNLEGMRNNYELLRENRLDQGKTLFALLVRTILNGPDNKSGAHFTVDGSTLPPFSALEGHIGPAGFYGQNESDGWFYKGITIKAIAQ
ncbi:MAG: hypothetical protein IIZ25_01480 [Thermoguttaceae bacterium]|nr:hypothetical protein [Thermoguttaceae bacterium]